MEFCEGCGNLLTPKKENGKIMMKCRTCGNIQEASKKNTKETFVVKKSDNLEGVIGAESNTVSHTCHKCNYDKAVISYIPALWGDEGNIILYKCTGCGYTEREEDH